jgi:hypothetical protein
MPAPSPSAPVTPQPTISPSSAPLPIKTSPYAEEYAEEYADEYAEEYAEEYEDEKYAEEYEDEKYAEEYRPDQKYVSTHMLHPADFQSGSESVAAPINFAMVLLLVMLATFIMMRK